MMRGLVESLGEHGNPLTKYQVTMDFLRFLGVSSVEELPDYEKLRSNDNVVRTLENAQQQAEDKALGKTEEAAESAAETTATETQKEVQ
jgi:hypothetical protein